MNELPYNQQDLINYLLGALPGNEAEHFDELNFTDDDFSHALSAAEKDLIDAYVQGELSGETLQKFQRHYLSSPLRSEKVEFAKTFQLFAEKHKNVLTETVSAEPKSEFNNGFFSRLNFFSDRKPFLQWSFAALAMIFLIFGGYLIFNNLLNRNDLQMAEQNIPAQNNQELPQSSEKKNLENINVEREIAQITNSEINTAPTVKKELVPKPKSNVELIETPKPKKIVTPPKITVATFILLPAMRSSNRIMSLSISKETTDVMMRLKLESDDYPLYQTILTDESNNILWKSESLKSKGSVENKIVNVSFPAKLLKSKIYSLRVSGVSTDKSPEIISDYPFRIVRQ